MAPDSLALIERHLTTGPGPVLDVGCGPGHLTAHLRSLEVDAFGLDPVPAFLDHAAAGDPEGGYARGLVEHLPVADAALGGLLAWFSLIHLEPGSLDAALVELRRAVSDGARLVVGFFSGDVVEPFDHKVTTAYYWPADELSARLRRAGFSEIERSLRPADPDREVRASAVLAAEAR